MSNTGLLAKDGFWANPPPPRIFPLFLHIFSQQIWQRVLVQKGVAPGAIPAGVGRFPAVASEAAHRPARSQRGWAAPPPPNRRSARLEGPGSTGGRRADVVDLEDHLDDLRREHDLLLLGQQRLDHVLSLHVCKTINTNQSIILCACVCVCARVCQEELHRRLQCENVTRDARNLQLEIAPQVSTRCPPAPTSVSSLSCSLSLPVCSLSTGRPVPHTQHQVLSAVTSAAPPPSTFPSVPGPLTCSSLLETVDAESRVVLAQLTRLDVCESVDGREA